MNKLPRILNENELDSTTATSINMRFASFLGTLWASQDAALRQMYGMRGLPIEDFFALAKGVLEGGEIKQTFTPEEKRFITLNGNHEGNK